MGQQAKDAGLTACERYVLNLISNEAAQACPVNWLPPNFDFKAYRSCRDRAFIQDRKGRGGFNVVALTAAGRAALAKVQS